MSEIKKWNKGLIFFCLVLAAVIVCEIASSAMRHQSTEELTAVMNTYLTSEAELYILPQEYASVSDTLAQGVSYLGYDRATDALSPYYAEGSNGYKASAALIGSVWSQQLKTKNKITSFHCNVLSVSNVNNVGDSVTATVKYKVRYEGSTAYLGDTSAEKQNDTYRKIFEQEVTFRKVGEEWKLVNFGGLELFYPFYDGTILLK